MKPAIIFILFILANVLPFAFVHGEESNAGIVQGIWFGNGDVFANNINRMYVAIRNNTGNDLTGTIDFFDNDSKLERKQVQALNGRIIESWTDWKPTYGTHTVKAILSRTQLFAIGSSTQSVDVESASAEQTLFVDYDTDKDAAGNKTDSDDDNDGVSDVIEIQNGTNPLVPDVPKIATTPSSQSNSSQTTANTSPSKSSDIAAHTPNQTDTTGPHGLEQYLAPSRAQTTFSGVTEVITKAKDSLDSYRQNRTNQQKEKATTSATTVNTDGFGEITRTNKNDVPTVSLPKIEGTGFFEKLINGVGIALTAVYTLFLTIISLILGHPMFIQLLLLILILFLLVRFAAKVGRRPKYK